MKKFTTPSITIQKLESENIITGSACFEVFACKECYCSLVGGCGNDGSGYTCTGLVCDHLEDI